MRIITFKTNNTHISLILDTLVVLTGKDNEEDDSNVDEEELEIAKVT